jgi:hypothetical protein
VTQRRPPLSPFLFQLSIQLFEDFQGGTLLKWIDEFELDSENKPREDKVLFYIQANDMRNLQKMKEILDHPVNRR